MSSNSVAACVVPCTRLCRDSNLELSRVTSCLNGTAPLLRYECLCMEQPLPFPTWVWIALGVGLFLAVSALVFVVWWCLFRKRTRIHKDTADVEGAKLLEGSHVPKSITNQMSEVMSVAALSELPSYEPELVAAVKSNDAMAIEKLLLEPFTNVNAFDCSGQTAFHLACANGYSSIVRALLGSPRVDVRARTDKGLTGFALACQEGNLEVLEILMDDPRIPRYTAGKGGVTPLMLAVLRKQTAVVHLLLKDNEINSNAADENGVTALHLAAELGDPEILAMFLAQPDRVDFSVIMTRNAKTPLDVAHPSVKAMLQTAVDAQRTYTWENFPIRPKA